MDGPGLNPQGQHAQQQRRQLCISRAAALDEAGMLEAAAEWEHGNICIDSVAFEDGAYAVKGRLRTAAPPELVYEVLIDYASLGRVFQNVLESEVVEEGGRKHLVQTCKWAFLIFSGTFRTSLAISEDPANLRLAFHLLHSSFMKAFVGQWHVQPAPGGPASSSVHPAAAAAAAAAAAGGGERVAAQQAQQAQQQRQQGQVAGSVVVHGLTVRPAVAPPAAVAHYTGKIFVQQVEGILADLEAELERRLCQQQQQQQLN
ncbi:hypothetical protein N2152v2_002738 [Parachlorella kessleri]